MSKDIIIIGSSTGGPKVLNEMFMEIPALDASIIIIQHVPPLFDKAIAERLNEPSKFTVKGGTGGGAQEAGFVEDPVFVWFALVQVGRGIFGVPPVV